MTTKYQTNSVYYNTPQTSTYLDIWKPTFINTTPTNNIQVSITSRYKHRPDLLSYDLYGTPKLWWVFVQRNMDVIRDPIYDFEPGTTIYIPKKSNLEKFLGV